LSRIPEQFVRDLLKQVDLEALISPFVKFTKQSGQNLFGICPFHEEKTPSFSVKKSLTTGREASYYYCFGCGRGGDAIQFLSEFEGLGYREAVARLAKFQGVNVPETRESDSGSHDHLAKHRETRKKNLLDLLTRIAGFYYSHLGRVKAYFKQRGISEPVQINYQLGFAPAINWRKKLNQKQQMREDLCHIGILSKKSGGGIFYESCYFSNSRFTGTGRCFWWTIVTSFRK